MQSTLDEIRAAGLYKEERVITTPQSVEIAVQDGSRVLNFCANNYLGLADHPELIEAAKQALDDHGFGLASVRFICGTQDLHKDLENRISAFFGTADTILYTSCFDANGGLFETLLGPEDAIISDALNHASIIDGIRLCKAQRHRYANSDMDELEEKLKATSNCRTRMIATDGVFSMDGYIARLDRIVELAEQYDALVMVDDSHATGFMGATGRGSAEYHGVMKRIDIFTSTLGKASGSISLLPRSARRWAAAQAGLPRVARRLSTCCGNALALTCFPTHCRHHWWRPVSGSLTCCPAQPNYVTGSLPIPVISARKWSWRDLISCLVNTRSYR
jgi:glycine C-acetyltransferase